MQRRSLRFDRRDACASHALATQHGGNPEDAQDAQAPFAPSLVTTMRLALTIAADRVPVTSRTPATKAKLAQRIVRSASEGITDAHLLVAAAVDEGSVPAL